MPPGVAQSRPKRAQDDPKQPQSASIVTFSTDSHAPTRGRPTTSVPVPSSPRLALRGGGGVCGRGRTMLESTPGVCKVDRFLASSAETPNPTRAPARTGDGPPASGVVKNPSQQSLSGPGSWKGVLPGQTGFANNHAHILGQSWLKYSSRFRNCAFSRAESDPRKFKFQFWKL